MKYNLSDPGEAAKFQMHIYDLANKRATINDIYFLGNPTHFGQYLRLIVDMIDAKSIISVDDANLDNVLVTEVHGHSSSNNTNDPETITNSCDNSKQLILPLLFNAGIIAGCDEK